MSDGYSINASTPTASNKQINDLKVHMELCIDKCLVPSMMAGAGSTGLWGGSNSKPMSFTLLLLGTRADFHTAWGYQKLFRMWHERKMYVASKANFCLFYKVCSMYS